MELGANQRVQSRDPRTEPARPADDSIPGAVGLGLVDEDGPRGFEIKLAVEPLFALLQDVGPVLFDRVASLLLRVMPCRAKKR